MTTSVEFAVQISCDTCVTKIEKCLEGVEGVKNVKISRDEGTVLVESSLPSSVLQEKLESTGRKAVLKGCGDTGEKEIYMFVKLEQDNDGYCPLCKPDPNDTKPSPDEEENGKKSRDMDMDGEELELKYSSDSDAGGSEDQHLTDLHTSEADEIWKIEDDMDADFDVIDADDEVKEEKEEVSKTETPEKKRKLSGDGLNLSSNVSGFLKRIKSNKIRHGEIDFSANESIALIVLVVPENEEDQIVETEAQFIKDSLLKEIVTSCQRVQDNLKDAFILRICDCKFISKSGWVCVRTCNKQTLDFILSWKVPSVKSKNFKVISALDKAPLQTIKFSIKSHWVSDLDLMLKLIHLQNRDIDTSRWELVNKTSTNNNTMQQFKYKIDFGSLVAIKKLDWSFYFELFPVRILEFNGKNVAALKAASTGRA